MMMKSFLVLILLTISLEFVFAEPPISSDEKEDKAIQQCNVTNPVQRNPSEIIAQGIVTGDVISLSQEEKCNLYCFLQKVNFFDENGNIHGAGLVNHTLKEAPSLAKYAEVIITEVFQTIRSTKGIQDKCLKAAKAYTQYLQNIFTLAVADGLQSFVDVKGEIVKAMIKGEPIPPEFQKKIEEFLQLTDGLLKSFAKGLSHHDAVVTETRASTPAQSLTTPSS